VGKVLKAYPTGNLFQLRHRNTATIGGADERPDAGAGYESDRDVFFFEDFDNANMRDPSCKATA
jgi:hypothetical protein